MNVTAPRVLTLYGRGYCHLCDDMLAALEPYREQYGFAVQWVDVDADPALEERFGEKVPVLMLGDREICHYFLDLERLQDMLTGLGAPIR